MLLLPSVSARRLCPHCSCSSSSERKCYLLSARKRLAVALNCSLSRKYGIQYVHRSTRQCGAHLRGLSPINFLQCEPSFPPCLYLATSSLHLNDQYGGICRSTACGNDHQNRLHCKSTSYQRVSRLSESK